MEWTEKCEGVCGGEVDTPASIGALGTRAAKIGAELTFGRGERCPYTEGCHLHTSRNEQPACFCLVEDMGMNQPGNTDKPLARTERMQSIHKHLNGHGGEHHSHQSLDGNEPAAAKEVTQVVTQQQNRC